MIIPIEEKISALKQKYPKYFSYAPPRTILDHAIQGKHTSNIQDRSSQSNIFADITTELKKKIMDEWQENCNKEHLDSDILNKEKAIERIKYTIENYEKFSASDEYESKSAYENNLSLFEKKLTELKKDAELKKFNKLPKTKVYEAKLYEIVSMLKSQSIQYLESAQMHNLFDNMAPANDQEAQEQKEIKAHLHKELMNVNTQISGMDYPDGMHTCQALGVELDMVISKHANDLQKSKEKFMEHFDSNEIEVSDNVFNRMFNDCVSIQLCDYFMNQKTIEAQQETNSPGTGLAR